MKIIDLIKAACKNKGVPEKYAERIEKTFKVTKAEEVESSIDNFKENLLPAITEAETEAKKAAEKAAVEAYEKQHGLKGGKPVEPEKTDPPKNDDPKLDPAIKALIEAQNKQIDELKGLITSSSKKVDNAEKAATAKKLLGVENLPEGWISRVQLESETSIEDQVKALKDEYVSIQQGVMDEAVKSGKYSPGFTAPKERSEEEWTKLMNEEGQKASNPGVVDLGIK